ncbi:TIGR00266 family protein [Kamptonema cortianum]|nr:TIGR00266 family protein [Kamptonema cortianum]
MTYEILFQPEFAVARIMLEPGESIRAESGAMMSMSPNIHIDSKITGGLGKMFGRMLGGESAFQTTFTSQAGQGEVVLAPGLPGDIVAVDVSQRPLMVTSGCYLAGSTDLQMETQASLKGFFGGEGLFMMRLFGQGLLLLSSYGAIRAVELQAGQGYVVDTGHLVAFSDGMGYNLKKATKSLIGSFTSGEGIVAELTGPGVVYTQTRTFSALLALIPTSR